MPAISGVELHTSEKKQINQPNLYLKILDIPLQSPSSAEKRHKQTEVSYWIDPSDKHVSALHVPVEELTSLFKWHLHELLQRGHDGVRLWDNNIINH